MRAVAIGVVSGILGAAACVLSFTALVLTAQEIASGRAPAVAVIVFVVPIAAAIATSVASLALLSRVSNAGNGASALAAGAVVGAAIVFIAPVATHVSTCDYRTTFPLWWQESNCQ